MEELPLPNHEKIMEELNNGKIPPQVQFFDGDLSHSFETKVRQKGIDQAS